MRQVVLRSDIIHNTRVDIPSVPSPDRHANLDACRQHTTVRGRPASSAELRDTAGS